MTGFRGRRAEMTISTKKTKVYSIRVAANTYFQAGCEEISDKGGQKA